MFDINEEINCKMLNADTWNIQLSACCSIWIENWNSVWDLVRYSSGKKKNLLSQSQGITKQIFTSAPPMLIFHSPVTITLS